MSKMNLNCTGSCLCGEVRYRIKGSVARFTLCHCGRCRKATGSAHTSNIMLSEAQVEWLHGENLVHRYKLSKTERYSTTFCSNCGCPLPRHVPEIGMIAVPAGSLDEDPGVTPQAHIFWNSRAQWLEPESELPRHAEYPPGV